MSKTNKIIFTAIIIACGSFVITSLFIPGLIAIFWSQYFCLYYQFLHVNVWHFASNAFVLLLISKRNYLLSQKIGIAYVVSCVAGYFCMYFPTVGFSGVLFALSGIDISILANRNTFFYSSKKKQFYKFLFISLAVCILPLAADAILSFYHKPYFFAYKINSLLHLACLVGGFLAYKIFGWCLLASCFVRR